MTQKEQKDSRKLRIRSRALELLDVAGYVPKLRLRQAMRIAARCEPPNVRMSDKLSHGPTP